MIRPTVMWIGAVLALAAGAASAQLPLLSGSEEGAGRHVIELTGNDARDIETDCGLAAQRGQAVNINSVNISGGALDGETVVITGRNSTGADAKGAADCASPGSRNAQGGVNVNSINIR